MKNQRKHSQDQPQKQNRSNRSRKSRSGNTRRTGYQGRRIKKAVPEETAGGVVFRHGKSGIEILMIQDARNRWTIPKGHVEPGERLEETAAREIEEETNLAYLKVLNHLGKTDFRFRKRDQLIMMTMHVFLVHAYKDSHEFEPEENEGIKDVKWFPANEALELIEYDEVGKMFLIGLKKIRDEGY